MRNQGFLYHEGVQLSAIRVWLYFKFVKFYVDVGEVFSFDFVSLVHLQDYRQSFLLQNLNWVDRSVQDRDLISLPRQEFLLFALSSFKSLLIRDWFVQKPIGPEMELEEYWVPQFFLQDWK